MLTPSWQPTGLTSGRPCPGPRLPRRAPHIRRAPSTVGVTWLNVPSLPAQRLARLPRRRVAHVAVSIRPVGRWQLVSAVGGGPEHRPEGTDIPPFYFTLGRASAMGVCPRLSPLVRSWPASPQVWSSRPAVLDAHGQLVSTVDARLHPSSPSWGGGRAARALPTVPRAWCVPGGFTSEKPDIGGLHSSDRNN